MGEHSGWAVVDCRTSYEAWKLLLGEHRFVAVEDLEDADANGAIVPLLGTRELVIIHADSHLLAETSAGGRIARPGHEWALRLREEADHFACSILLQSFRRRADAEADDGKLWGDCTLKNFLRKDWQVRWKR